MMRFSLLQIFRGWAAILVLLIHASYIAAGQHGMPIAGNFFTMGNAGVDFFFVLSGFLITHLHLGDIGRREKLNSYVRKRFVRGAPYLLACYAGNPASFFSSFRAWGKVTRRRHL